MTDTQLAELITEGLTLSNQVEFNEERYKYAMARMDIIQKEIQKDHDSIFENKKRAK